MTENTSDNKGIISLKETISYGIGSLGYGLENAFVLGYLVFFATEALGIEAALLGIIMFIPKLLDVFSDFIIMNFVDKTKTRFGTYRPWLLSAFPLSILMILIFLAPDFLETQMQNIIWISVIYFLMVAVCETAYWCPYAAMSAVISSYDPDRTKLVSWRSVFECITSVIIACLAIPLVNYFGGTYKSAAGWRYTAIIFGVLSIICMLVCLKNVKERVPVNNHASDDSGLTITQKIRIIITNKPLLRLIVIFLCFLPMYTYATLITYFCTYNLGNADLISPLSLVAIVVDIITSFSCKWVSSKIGKNNTIILGCVLMLLSLVIFVFANNFITTAIFIVIKDIGLMLVYVTAFSLVPVVSDEIKNEHGMDNPGLVLGTVSSFQKLFAAIGGVIATVIISISQYDAVLEVQSSVTENWFRFGIIGINFIFTTIILCVILFKKNSSGVKDII